MMTVALGMRTWHGIAAQREVTVMLVLLGVMTWWMEVWRCDAKRGTAAPWHGIA